jgi:hypothetical protein
MEAQVWFQEVCVGFVVEKVALWQVFLWVLQFLPDIIPSALHIHIHLSTNDAI